MSDINVRSESVDVEQIMRQIRARIREKRGADYTEAELQQLATVKLEKFLDPRGLRSNMVEHFRQSNPPPPNNYEFEADTLFESHRALVRAFRKLFRPLLKLFFNPDRITTALHLQSKINAQAAQRWQREMLSYELLHNMTLEITRLGIEVHNLKMRVESLSSRVDFDERRAKAFESVVQYRTPGPRPAPADEDAADSGTPEGDAAAGDRRRRRRRRRRRPGSTMAEAQGQTWNETSGGDSAATDTENASTAATAGGDDGAAAGPDPKDPAGQ